MITADERAFIEAHAYIPEHIPAYVTPISGAEAFLIGEFLVYVDGRRLIFVGYPLEGKFDAAGTEAVLEEARRRFEPALISAMAPQALVSLSGSQVSDRDFYYRLDLDKLDLSKKLRNALRRASQEVSIGEREDYSKEHKRLAHELVRRKRIPRETQSIFKNIPAYLGSPTARLYAARDRNGKLVAFDVAEFGSGEYTFYMFNFRSRARYVPGSSDLLLWRIIREARAQGKRYLNLGLGIDPGVAFFKSKWGGVPFLEHTACIFRAPETLEVDELFDML